MSGVRKSLVLLAVIFFVVAFVCASAYACGGNRAHGDSNSKVMSCGGHGGFHKPDGHHGGGHEGMHKGGGDGEHHGRGHHGGNRQHGSSGTGTTDTTDSTIDFSSYTDSASLVTQAWTSYGGGDTNTAIAFSQETIDRYSETAAEQQASLSGFAEEGSESDYWALNDVATAYFIMGSAYAAAGNESAAATAFNKIISDYSYAQCYDPDQDLYWSVAEGAQTALDAL